MLWVGFRTGDMDQQALPDHCRPAWEIARGPGLTSIRQLVRKDLTQARRHVRQAGQGQPPAALGRLQAKGICQRDGVLGGGGTAAVLKI